MCKYSLIIVVLLCLNLSKLNAQDYKKDSLQFKVITHIKYANNTAEKIVLKKVICDYCTDVQTEALGQQALKIAKEEQEDPKNRKQNGIKILSIYIRLSKKDFAALNK